MAKYKASIDGIEEDVRREQRTNRVGDAASGTGDEITRKLFIFIKLNDVCCIPPLVRLGRVVDIIRVDGKVRCLFIKA